MGAVNLPIGTSNSGTNDWADVHGEDQAIVDVLNGNVDADNIAAGGVGSSEIATDAVGSAEIVADAVGGAELATGYDFYDYGIVTTLPTGTPTLATGYRCTYTNSLTSPTYYWNLVYNGSESGSYKWAVLGGSPVRGTVATLQTTTSTTPTDLATTGPDVIVPLQGDYILSWGAGRQDSGAGSSLCRSEVWNASIPIVLTTGNFTGTATTSDEATDTAYMEERIAAIGGGSTLRVRYYVTSGTARFGDRWLSAMPVRVI